MSADISFSAKCERVRQNNGVVEVLLKHHAHFTNEATQDQYALLNVQVAPGEFRVGDEWICEFTKVQR